jgi:hypothetical protein
MEQAKPQPAIDKWSKATRDVNMWRGECLQLFCVAELAIIETLLALKSDKKGGAAVRIGHLAGQRLDEIQRVLGPEGGFAQQGKPAIKSLTSYCELESYRNHLAHNIAKVTIAKTGDWVAVLKRMEVRADQAEEKVLFVEEAKAEIILSDLEKKTRHLTAVLGSLRRTLKP